MKKILAAILTCTLSAYMLMGCGSASDDSVSDTNVQTDDTQDTSGGAADADDTQDTSGGAADDAGDSASEEFTTVNKGVLTMATNAYFPPYEYYEGEEIIGIDAEIAKAIADKLGLELKIEDMEFNSIVIAVDGGKADMGLAGMTVTEERKETVNFTDSYATGIQAIIVAEDSDIASLDDLSEKKIGVQLATTGDTYATDDFGEDFVERYNKGADAVMALKQGKIDAVIIDKQPALSFVESTEGLKLLDTDYVQEDYAACIAKSNEPLLNAVNGALTELKEDGTIQNILDKYIKAE